MMASENIQTHSQVKYITSKYFMQLDLLKKQISILTGYNIKNDTMYRFYIISSPVAFPVFEVLIL
jgi:hypothetical protein